MQLSAKALLAPLNPAISQKVTQDDKMPEEDDTQPLPEDDAEDNEDDDKDNDDKDEDDGINELEQLSEDKQAQVLEDTAEVHNAVTKVSFHKAAVCCCWSVIDYWLT
jgi:hypothetical protein